MASISSESHLTGAIIPSPLTSIFLQKTLAQRSSQETLRPVLVVLTIAVAATFAALHARTPFWLAALLTVFTALAASLYLTIYVYYLCGNLDGPASRRETGETDGFSLVLAACGNFHRHGSKADARCWFARDLMRSLGYDDWQLFTNAIHRAMGSCTTLNIAVGENFARTRREVDGLECEDYRFSNLAYYLVVLNGDTFRPGVAAVQARAYLDHLRR
jgi:hypothetical protein